MPTSEPTDPRTLLKDAFQANDAARFREVLERFSALKAQLNEPVGPFNSPLILNVRTREMLDVLLDAGADINVKSSWWAGGFGLLHSAPLELAAYAFERGASVDAHAAARLGMLPKLREILAREPDAVRAPGGDGQTPLHFASTLEIAQLLLEHGADIDARDVDHESTPAQYMVKDRQPLARYLVERGCGTDILMAAALGEMDLVRRHLTDNPESIRMRVSHEHFPMINSHAGGTIYQWTLGWYVSPHQVARQFGHEEIYQLLMRESPPSVRLLVAAWLADESAVNAVKRENPALVGSFDESERQQVAHAARNNQADAVRVMLGAGLPVDAVGQHRATPLHWAAFHGNAPMAREILRHRPPLEKTDADFQATPLGWAMHGSEHGWYCRTGDYPATVEALLQAGAKVEAGKISGTEAVRAVLQRFGARA
jgi:hypothetical protein